MQKYESCIFEMANHFEEECSISDSCVNQFFNELYNGSDLLKQAFYSLIALRVSMVFLNIIITFWENIGLMQVKEC